MYEKQKHFENIYGKIRGYACLASLKTQSRASGKVLDLVCDDHFFVKALSNFTSDSQSTGKNETPEKKHNIQHRCNAQYICMIKLMDQNIALNILKGLLRFKWWKMNFSGKYPESDLGGILIIYKSDSNFN